MCLVFLMCYSNSEMYEGKNIHYSSYDKKPLCSFSGKVCNQHRLNGYAFCVRHILEDPTAPFKRCAYVAKSSKQTCTQAIPQHEERRYCNNHMQVLGMLPKKERKKKEKPDQNIMLPSPIDIKVPFEDRVKSRFNTKIRNNDVILKVSKGLEDPDDPYAFPDPSGDAGSRVGTPGSGPLSESPSDTPNSVVKSPGDGCVSSIAKLYPELAEKLEKIKPKQEIKVKEKGKSKISRTMNQLQTRIAQNKIKDKQKRVQESSSQSQSPSHFGNLTSSPNIHSPGMHAIQMETEKTLTNNHDGSIQHREMLNSSVVSDLPGFQDLTKRHDLHSSQELNKQYQSLQHSLHDFNRQKDLHPTLKQDGSQSPQEIRKRHDRSSQDMKRPRPPFNDLQSTGVQGMTQSVSQTGVLPGTPIPGLSPSNISGLPPGLLPNVTPSMLQALSPNSLSRLMSGPLSLSSQLQGQHQKRQLESRENKPAQIPTGLPLQNVSHVPVPGLHPALRDENFLHHQQALLNQRSNIHLQQQVKPQVTSATMVSKETQPKQQQHQQPPPHFPVMPEPPPYRPSNLSLTSSSSVMPVVSTSTVTTPSVTVTSSSHQGQGLPPPPPYAPTTTTTQSTISSVLPSTKSKSSRTSTVPTFSVIPHEFLQVTRTPVRKIQNVLNEKDAHKRLRVESSIKYYNQCLKRKKDNHSLLGLGLSSSEDSSGSDDEMLLPWQPDWFTASSDEDNFDDDEDDQDDALRTAKVALVRARLRRQCFQSRKSHKANHSQYRNYNSATLSLIQAARDQPQASVKALQEILQKQSPPIDKYKMRGFEKRQCCYKNDDEVQCKNPVLPCTNHCQKHIMYNVDQQLFDYCTAKFADNTQCCVPVFDFKHELPLCIEHGKKADNYHKSQDGEIKPKRQRKKTKPSALTRPPKKGKKKKNQRRNIRPQKPSPPSLPTGLTVFMEDSKQDISHVTVILTSREMPPLYSIDTKSQSETVPDNKTDEEVLKDEEVAEVNNIENKPEIDGKTQNTAASTVITSVSTATKPSPPQKSTTTTIEVTKESTEKSSLSEIPDHVLEANFAPDMDKALGLPLEQASKLLEEQDFTDVFNKIPDDFDLFSGKNGDFLPTKEEVEELERSLAAVNREVRCAQQSWETLSQVEKDLIENEEQLKEMAATLLSQSLHGNGNMTGEMCNGLPDSVSADSVSAVPNRNVPISTDISMLQAPARTASEVTNNYNFIAGQQQQGTVLSNVQVGSVTQSNTALTITVNATSQNSRPTLPNPNVFTHPVHQQRFLTAHNSLPPGYHSTHVLPGQQFLQQQQAQQSPSNIPVQQLVNASSLTGIRNINLSSIDGRLTVDNIQGTIPTLTKSQSLPAGTQLQNNIPVSHVAWQGNLGNVISFQNGFPLQNATFVHTGAETSQGNIKFGLNMHLNASELKELAQFQSSTHSATATGTVRAPHQGLTNAQPLPAYQGPPPYKASSGSGS
ncbi:hypothetical protein KUTeg_002725 [Tegillarca granosa]|uniref:KANL2-like probable zinc-finger domain-containing protein n=1 Tax=Tegillarca granosa TaxID=220873 RepID=A0ABQ9FSL2_TEGGR|nr:hypothetical protein KUTeg_002725 [Tegillarca granosa]